MNHHIYTHLPDVGARVGAIAEPGEDPSACAGTVCRIVKPEGRSPYALVNMDDHTTAELHMLGNSDKDAPCWLPILGVTQQIVQKATSQTRNN